MYISEMSIVEKKKDAEKKSAMESFQNACLMNFAYAELGDLAMVIVKVDADCWWSTGNEFDGGTRNNPLLSIHELKTLPIRVKLMFCDRTVHVSCESSSVDIGRLRDVLVIYCRSDVVEHLLLEEMSQKQYNNVIGTHAICCRYT